MCPGYVLPHVLSNVGITGKGIFKFDCSSVRLVSSDIQQDQVKDQGGHHESDVMNSICEAVVSYWGGLQNQKEWTGKPITDTASYKAVNHTLISMLASDLAGGPFTEVKLAWS